MLTDNDGSQLLAAIVATPEDDTVRLAYADWLEENGEVERAEFIRVQVQLGRCKGLHVPLTIRLARKYAMGEWVNPPLETRASCLLSEFATAWVQDFGIEGIDAATAYEWGWSRGFISSVSCRMNEVREEQRVTASTGGEWFTGEFVPTPWARAIVAAIPTLQEMRLTDKEPWSEPDDPDLYWYLSGEYGPEAGHPSQCVIPEPFLDILARERFTTREAAITALARVVCKWVKDWVKESRP